MHYEEIKQKFIDKITPKFPELKCISFFQNKVNITVFYMKIENDKILEECWEKINGEIALEFQSYLSTPIERWNIYEIFISSNPISSDLKYKIEQDKYCGRKIIYDDFDEVNNKEVDIKQYINKRLFELDLKLDNKVETPKINLKKLIEDSGSELIKHHFSNYFLEENNEN